VLKVAPHLFREYMYLQHDIRVYGSINDDVHLTSSNDKPMDTASRQLQPAACDMSLITLATKSLLSSR